MDEHSQQIARSAEKTVAMSRDRGGGELDYCEASLAVLEEMLSEAAEWSADLTPEQQTTLIQNFGSYVFEVARRAFGGRYQWHDNRDQPVLVVGEPAYRVAMLAWDKVRGRLGGDAGDDIPFFYSGFAATVKRAMAGTDVLYV